MDQMIMAVDKSFETKLKSLKVPIALNDMRPNVTEVPYKALRRILSNKMADPLL